MDFGRENSLFPLILIQVKSAAKRTVFGLKDKREKAFLPFKTQLFHIQVVRYAVLEFKSLKNIESNFRLIRICCALFAGLCAAVAVASVGFSYAFAERQRQKIYVLDGGRSLMVALSQDLSQNRPVEAREHVRRFHELFFTLSPDKAAIESNLNRALLMADRSALSYYKALSEKGFFNRLIAGGISQTVRIDSIRCNFDSYPYQVTTYARQRIALAALLLFAAADMWMLLRGVLS